MNTHSATHDCTNSRGQRHEGGNARRTGTCPGCRDPLRQQASLCSVGGYGWPQRHGSPYPPNPGKSPSARCRAAWAESCATIGQRGMGVACGGRGRGLRQEAGSSPARGCARLGLEFQYKQGPRLDRRVFPFFRRSTLPGPELAFGGASVRQPGGGGSELCAGRCSGGPRDRMAGAGCAEPRGCAGAAPVRRRLSSAPRRGGRSSAGEHWRSPRPRSSRACCFRAPGCCAPNRCGAEHWGPEDPGIWGRCAASRSGQAFCLES